MNYHERGELENQARQVADAIEKLMRAMIEQDGFSCEPVIAGVHAKAVAAMIAAYGRNETASILRITANTIAQSPSLDAAILAACKPAGTA